MNNITNIIDSPIIKAILLFYILIGSSYVKDLYSGQMKDFLEDNRYVHHIMGLSIMIVIYGSFLGIKEPKNMIFYSIITYLWFIITTKLDVQWNITIIVLLICGYIFQYYLENREDGVMIDTNLSKDDKERIHVKNMKIKRIIIICVLIVTFIGTILNFNKKMDQYGNEFDMEQYLFSGRHLKIENPIDYKIHIYSIG